MLSLSPITPLATTSTTLAWIGAILLLLGEVAALLSLPNLKRVIVISTVAEVGYVLIGLGLGGASGETGAYMHLGYQLAMRGLVVAAGWYLVSRTGSAKLTDLVGSGELYKLVKNPAAYFIEYRDGLRATLLMLDGALRDYNFAARVRGMGVVSNQFLLTPTPNVTYSACLMSKAEEMFETGRAPYPVERTLTVSGILEACLTSRIQDHQRLQTPQIEVRYRAPRLSQYCRA